MGNAAFTFHLELILSCIKVYNLYAPSYCIFVILKRLPRYGWFWYETSFILYVHSFTRTHGMIYRLVYSYRDVELNDTLTRNSLAMIVWVYLVRFGGKCVVTDSYSDGLPPFYSIRFLSLKLSNHQFRFHISSLKIICPVWVEVFRK